MSPIKLMVFTIIAMVLVSTIVIMSMIAFQKAKHIPESIKMMKYLRRHTFYYDFWITKQTFRRIDTQIASLGVYSFDERRVTAVKFFEKSALTGLALFLLGFIFLGDLISGILLAMFAVVLMNTTINNRIDDVNFTTLKATSSYIQSVREAYTRVRNVPDAVNDAKCPPILRLQVEKIYAICTAPDARERLDRFYEECPQRTLKTLATTCYIRSDSGEDTTGGKESPFKQALSLIKDEVDMEVRRQINQRLLFKGLTFLPFIPLFIYPIIVKFYTSMISATASVFNSSIGFIIKLVVVLVCFVCYYVLSTINNSSMARTDDRSMFLKDWLQHAKVHDFAMTLLPTNERKLRELEKKLNGCLSHKDKVYFYFEKYFYATAVFLIAILFSIIIIISARKSVWNSLDSTTMSANLTYTIEQEVQVRAYDAEVLNMETLPTEIEMTEVFTSIFPKEPETTISDHVKRLSDKYTTYHNLHFYWWFSFIYIAASVGAFYIPNFLLKLRITLVQSESELDVLQLQTVIAILMDTPLDTMSCLYWLSKSSDIHRDILTEAFHYYAKDPLFALQRLQYRSASNEFASMCEKLITTIHQVTIAEAFEDLVSERNNVMKIREVVQLDQLKSKRNIASPIATAPMMVWMAMAFILPIVIVAVRSAVTMLGQLEF